MNGIHEDIDNDRADLATRADTAALIVLVSRLHANIEPSVSIHLGTPSSALISSYFPSYFSLSQWSSLATHINITKAMKIRRVMNICNVSHVTITVLSFAFNMSFIALYSEEILLPPIAKEVTHLKNDFEVHYH